ncbi:MAG: glycerophosphodiester phosphodiesterase family protein [Eubacteriales bacterium]
MKKPLSYLILLLAAAMLFASCTGNGTATTEETTAEAPEAEKLSIIADGATEYKLIRSEKASSEIKSAFTRLRAAINEKYGVSIVLDDDFEMPGTDVSARHPYEILVGATNREESGAALNGLGYNDSVIAVKGSRVVISGGNDEAVVRAVDLFIEKYMTDGSLSLASDLLDVTKAEYAKENVTVGGVPLGEYTVAYASGYADYAKELAHRIGKLTGARLNVVVERNAPEEHVITVKLDVSAKDGGPDDFAIRSSDTSLTVSAGNKTAVGMACARLSELLADEKVAYELSDLEFEYTLPASRDYVDDIFSLPMHWAIEFKTPDWMLDFDEKMAATLTPDGRLMSCAHRGDMVYYPENSIEGIISAIRMGCDMIEIDPQLTKDGVFILIHDATLTRTTNVEEMAGKNGLPSSHNVADWTYEQLMQLNLKEGNGGSSAKLTPYKIPTLEEVIKVSANRIFIRLDVKGPSNSSTPFWNYERDIWPLMTKYKSYSNVIFTWHSWFTASSYDIPRTYRAKAEALGAYAPPVFVPDGGTLSSTMRPIRSNNFNPGVRLGCDFSKYSYTTYLADNAEKLAAYKTKLRTYADVHGTSSSFPENSESHEYYAALYEGGINYQLVNKALLLCTYIAENFEPTPYSK